MKRCLMLIVCLAALSLSACSAMTKRPVYNVCPACVDTRHARQFSMTMDPNVQQQLIRDKWCILLPYSSPIWRVSRPLGYLSLVEISVPVDGDVVILYSHLEYAADRMFGRR